MEQKELETLIDEISQSIFGKPSDEITPQEYATCQKEARLFIEERTHEAQFSRA